MTAMAVEAPIVCSETQVVAAERLGESFVRLVLAGPELRSWSADVVETGTVSDAYIKLLVPPPGGPGVAPDPADIRSWLALPEAERGWMRTYTVRCADTVEMGGSLVPALTVDVVVHPGEGEGPGSAWAGAVRVGDMVRLIGPGRGHAPWGAWAPAEADRVVCAGDETAVPALLAIADELAAEPVGTRDVQVLVEVPTAADAEVLAADVPEFVSVVSRGGADDGGSAGDDGVDGPGGEPGTALVRRLADVLDLGEDSVATVLDGRRPDEREWQLATSVSAGQPYVFLAGEAGLVRAMRRLAVDAAGVPKSSVAFMGYWRRGAAES